MVVGIVLVVLIFLSLFITLVYWMEAIYEEVTEIKKYLNGEEENENELGKR